MAMLARAQSPGGAFGKHAALCKYAALCACTIACMFLADAALAQTGPPASPTGKTKADALFNEAVKLMKANRYVEACPKLEKSHRLDPSTPSAFNLARCYQYSGRPVSAWNRFRDAEAIARANNDAKAQAASRGAYLALEPKLAKLVIQVPAQSRLAGLQIRLDKALVAQPAWGAATPIDPGTHLIEAKAPGWARWSQAIVILPKPGIETVVVPPPQPEQAAPTAAPTAPPIAPPIAPPVAIPPVVRRHPPPRRPAPRRRSRSRSRPVVPGGSSTLRRSPLPVAPSCSPASAPASVPPPCRAMRIYAAAAPQPPAAAPTRTATLSISVALRSTSCSARPAPRPSPA